VTPDGSTVDRLAVAGTAAVSDAMDSLGIRCVLSGIVPRVPGARVCGPAFPVAYRPIALSEPTRADGSGFRGAANYLDDVPAGSVVVVDNAGSTSCTTWGSLLTLLATKRGVLGTVLHGSARDIAEIRAKGYPLFSTGLTMVSGKNRVELDSVGLPIDILGTRVRSGDVVLADDSGALVVPAAHAAEVAARAERVVATERGIAAAVDEGVRLDRARAIHGYATPWREWDKDSRGADSG